MIFKLSVLSVVAASSVGCGPPPAPKVPSAPGVSVIIDASQRNPVITWTAHSSGLRATNVIVSSPDCRGGAEKTYVDSSTTKVTGGSDAVSWYIVSAQAEGFDGPIVYGSNTPGTKTTYAARDLPGNCSLVATVMFSDQSQAVSASTKLMQPTSAANADADMKKFDYDKPWVSKDPASKKKEIPPPDLALQTEFAGTYKCESIGGKPMPKDYGNGCKMTAVWVEAAADGTYKSGYSMSCTTGPIDGTDTGTYGVTATTAAFSKDPDTEPATRQSEGFTRDYGGEKYVFKRTSKPPAAPTPAP